MDTLQPCLLILFSVLHLILASVMNPQVDHRNLFAQRVCCKRQSHFVYIGQDISGSPVSVDVGICRSHCGSPQRTTLQEAGQQERSKHFSMLELLRSKKLKGRASGSPDSLDNLGNMPSCGVNQICGPTGMRVNRVLLFEGPREVDIIEDCECETRLSQCLRVPALKTYFHETPYETVIDVGGCSSSKGAPEGFSCVPTKFDSAIVETPNKVDLIQTVETCELKNSCYKVPYVEYYYEIVDLEGGIKQERLKEIDVGRCLGGCTTGNRCLLRSPSDPEVCRLWAERPSNACVPQGFESHMFLDQHEQIRTVLSITSCMCQT